MKNLETNHQDKENIIKKDDLNRRTICDWIVAVMKIGGMIGQDAVKIAVPIIALVVLSFNWNNLTGPVFAGNVTWGESGTFKLKEYTATKLANADNPTLESNKSVTNSYTGINDTSITTKGWIYLGTSRDYKNLDLSDTNNMYFESVPDKTIISSLANKELKTIVNLNIRDDKPKYSKDSGWGKGAVINIVPKGKWIKVKSIATDIPAKGGGIRVWAFVIVRQADLLNQ